MEKLEFEKGIISYDYYLKNTKEKVNKEYEYVKSILVYVFRIVYRLYGRIYTKVALLHHGYSIPWRVCLKNKRLHFDTPS